MNIAFAENYLQPLHHLHIGMLSGLAVAASTTTRVNVDALQCIGQLQYVASCNSLRHPMMSVWDAWCEKTMYANATTIY